MEAKERSTEAAALAAELASLRADADAEASAREGGDTQLKETIAALGATVVSNEEKLAERLQQEKQARLSLDADIRAWTEGILRVAVEEEKKERSEADKQEGEARLFLMKELYAWTDENVARSEAARNATAASTASMRRAAEKDAADIREITAMAVDEERKERIDAGKSQSSFWKQALAELGSTLRLEAQENHGAAAASQEQGPE